MCDGTSLLLQNGFAQAFRVTLPAFARLSNFVGNYIVGDVAATPVRNPIQTIDAEWRKLPSQGANRRPHVKGRRHQDARRSMRGMSALPPAYVSRPHSDHWDLAQAALFPLYELRGCAHR
jgi:hypothetical protein